jgi:hypothetical protein
MCVSGILFVLGSWLSTSINYKATLQAGANFCLLSITQVSFNHGLTAYVLKLQAGLPDATGNMSKFLKFSLLGVSFNINISSSNISSRLFIYLSTLLLQGLLDISGKY